MKLRSLPEMFMTSSLIMALLAGCALPITPQAIVPTPTATTASATDSANPPLPEIKPSSNVSVYVSGLDNPRGLKFGPDGALYVAEGGAGGMTGTTATDCEQVPVPIGPYTGAMTARISKIDKDGKRTTVSEHLPSSQTAPGAGSFVMGVSDIAFISDTLYALIAGAGCSHGLKGTANRVVKVNADGSVTQIADLSAFYQANPTKNMNKADFEPDGTPFSMIALQGNLYVIEPNHGSLEKITPDGQISRVIDISAMAGHVVPTTMVYHDHFFVGNLSIFPVPANAATIMEITTAGQITKTTPGLTAVTGVAFDRQDRLYALEATTVNGQLPVPGTGKVVRVDLTTGQLQEIATGLAFPTAMAFGPDNWLYVANYGFGFPAGKGEIVRIQVP